MPDHHFWLSEAQFARLEPLLPNKPRGVPRVDDRRVQHFLDTAVGSAMARSAGELWALHDLLQPFC